MKQWHLPYLIIVVVALLYLLCTRFYDKGYDAGCNFTVDQLERSGVK